MPIDPHIVESIAARLFPDENRLSGEESFPKAALDLEHFGIVSAEVLEVLIKRQLSAVMQEDRKQAVLNLEHKLPAASRKRARNGVWFSHTGLIRECLRLHDPKEWRIYSGEDKAF